MYLGVFRPLGVLLAATAVSMAAASAANADAGVGEALFKRHCAVCHSAKPGEILTGPSLAKLVGRKAGATPGYPYSPALKGSGLVWTADALDGFIAAPRKAVPKTNMAFTGLPNPSQRSDLIAYLATLK